MSDIPRTIWTIGQIVRKCNEPVHRIQYAIKSRNIQPVAKVGNARVFDETDVEQIIGALQEMNSRRDPQGSTKALHLGGAQ